MKIIGKSEFLAMPSGTLYLSQITSDPENGIDFQKINIKGMAKKNYYNFIPLGTPDIEGLNNKTEFHELPIGISIPMDIDGYMGGGWIAEDEIFCVLESDDLMKLMDVVSKALSVSDLKE